MKKTALFLMVIFLMIGVCGCGMLEVKNEKNNVIPYLRDKYGEDFTLVSYEMRSIDIPYDEAVCTNALGQKVKVYIDYESEGVVMSDDYYGTLKMPEYYIKLQSILDEHNITCKLFTQFNANYFDGQYNHKTPLSQAMAESKEQFYTRTTLFSPENNYIDKTTIAQLRDTLLSENMTMYLAVYKVDENVYTTLDITQKASVYIQSENGIRPLYEEIVK